MRYSSRLFLYAPFVVLLVLAAVAMVRWEQVAQEWETRLHLANSGREIAPGMTLHFASEQIGGFPFNVDVVLNKLIIVVQSTRGPISFASEQFAIHALTYGRAQQVMEAAGLQTLTWTDAEGGAHRFAFVPGSLHASAVEKGGRLARLDLDLSAFASSALTGARAQLHIRAAPARDALDFVIRAENVRMKSSDAVLPHVEVDGSMAPATPLSHLLSARDAWRSALGEWRLAHGALRLDRIAIAWNASRLVGDGVLALDDGNRVAGKMKLQLSGAARWKPTRLVENPFTSALQELTNASLRGSETPLPLSLDIHNGAAIVHARGIARSAGRIDAMF